MLDTIFHFLTSLLILTGVITIFYYLILRLLTPRRRPNYVLILPLTEEGNPVGLLGSAFEKRNLCGETKYCEIIAVDFDLRAETRSFVENMYKGYDRFTLCDYSQMESEIKNKLMTKRTEDLKDSPS